MKYSVISQKKNSKIDKLLLIKSIIEFIDKIEDQGHLCIPVFKLSYNHLIYVNNLISSGAENPVVHLAIRANNVVAAKLAVKTYNEINNTQPLLYTIVGYPAGSYLPVKYADCVANARTPEIACVIREAFKIVYIQKKWSAKKLEEYFEKVKSIKEAKKAFSKICEEAFLDDGINKETDKIFETEANKTIDGPENNLELYKSLKKYILNTVGNYLKNNPRQLNKIAKQL